MKANSAEPAYPVEVSVDGEGKLRGAQTSNFSEYSTGLSKLEYFVAKAMQGLLSNPEWMKIYEKEKYLMQSSVVAEVATGMAKETLEHLNKLK